MTECNGCGGCCNPVVLPYTQEEAKQFEIDAEDLRWTLEDLTPISDAEALVLERAMVRRFKQAFAYGEADDRAYYFSCRHFDVATRQCQIYDHRPPVCQRFPWLTGVPIPGAALPASCEFRRDIGETPYPIPDLTS